MAGRNLDLTIAPSYAQVLIQDNGTITDVPNDDEFGRAAKTVSSSQVIHVFTVPEHFGDVGVHVTRSGQPPFGSVLVLEKIMDFKSGRVGVNTADYPLADEAVGKLDLDGPGRYIVKLYTLNSRCQGYEQENSRPDYIFAIISERLG